MDPALFRNISLETNDNGRSGVELALAARRIIDRDGNVAFNPDARLPATVYLSGDELIQVSQGAKPRQVQLRVAQLRQWSSGQFSVRFQSIGDDADLARTRKIVETVGASPSNPYILRFDQFILEEFASSESEGAPAAQFDLVERDASDVDVFEDDGAGGLIKVSGGESEVTLATKDGFTNGTTTNAWSRFAKVITSDKIFKVVFIPGSTGAGIYSMRLDTH